MADKPLVQRKIAARKDKVKTKSKPLVVQKVPKVQKDKSGKAAVKPELKDEPQDGDGEVIGALNQHVLDQDYSWETDSMLADMLDNLPKDTIIASPDFCTPEEIGTYRRQLIDIGPAEFFRQNIDSGRTTAKKLLTAFAARPPAFLENHPAGDEAYHNLLLLAMTRELAKRPKLLAWNSVDDVVHLLQTSKNIMVITGAGISTSLGIPDFRSAAGLYSKLGSKLRQLGIDDPQDVFHIDQFRSDPNVFFQVAQDILPETDRFTPTHAFIAMLEKRNKLLVNYTQNIDNLEAKAGISPEKLMQCHGSFATATCFACGHQVPGETIFPQIKAGEIPYCPKCTTAKRTSLATRKRKLKRNPDGSTDAAAKKKPARRSAIKADSDDSDGDYGGYAAPIRRSGGILKPDITFFGEALPRAFNQRLEHHDQYAVDLLIVIGTSLKVQPISEVPLFLPRAVPQIVISRTPVNHHTFDIDLLGDCDVVVAELARRCGWALPHPMIPHDQHISVETMPGYCSRHVFSAFSPSVAAAADAKKAAALAAKMASSNNDNDNGVDGREALGAVSGNRDREASLASTGENGDAVYAAGTAVVTTTRSGRRSARESSK